LRLVVEVEKRPSTNNSPKVPSSRRRNRTE
jgi:hypothetical protein